MISLEPVSCHDVLCCDCCFGIFNPLAFWSMGRMLIMQLLLYLLPQIFSLLLSMAIPTCYHARLCPTFSTLVRTEFTDFHVLSFGWKAATRPTAQSRTITATSAPRATNIGGPGSKVQEAKIEELSGQVMEMKLTLEGMEKERDFYFNKLRDIELLCQDQAQGESNPIITKILEKLYATEEGFAPPDDVEGVDGVPQVDDEY